jgi:hypothetical protein
VVSPIGRVGALGCLRAQVAVTCTWKVWRAVPRGRQGTVPLPLLLGKSHPVLWFQSTRHLRQRVVPGRPGQPVQQQVSIPAAGEVWGETGVWRWPGLAGGQKGPAGPGPLESVSA